MTTSAKTTASVGSTAETISDNLPVTVRVWSRTSSFWEEADGGSDVGAVRDDGVPYCHLRSLYVSAPESGCPQTHEWPIHCVFITSRCGIRGESESMRVKRMMKTLICLPNSRTQLRLPIISIVFVLWKCKWWKRSAAGCGAQCRRSGPQTECGSTSLQERLTNNPVHQIRNKLCMDGRPRQLKEAWNNTTWSQTEQVCTTIFIYSQRSNISSGSSRTEARRTPL